MSEQPPDDLDLDPGTAGASARREHERRLANRENRTRERHPRTAGLRLFWQDAPQHEGVWATGASGEERLARFLGERCGPDVVVLHDRRIPGRRTNIDHLAIAPSGVWVIDAKSYKGKVEVHKPLFAEAKLKIAGRDKSKLATGVANQVEQVKAALAEVAPDVPVHGVMCFVENGLPLLGTLSFNGCLLLRGKALVKRLNAKGDLSVDVVHGIARTLAARFPSA